MQIQIGYKSNHVTGFIRLFNIILLLIELWIVPNQIIVPVPALSSTLGLCDTLHSHSDDQIRLFCFLNTAN